MALAVISTANARRDIQKAIDWENNRSPNLGKRFLEYLQMKIGALSVTPFIGSVRYDNVRCTTTDVFEYLIHYTVDLELQRITILRVLHMKREPIW